MRSAAAARSMACALLVAAACSGTYTPPVESGPSFCYATTIDRPFAEVWSDVIELVSSSSLPIRHVDRSAGLVMLGLPSDTPVEELVDCGRLARSGHDAPLLDAYRQEGSPPTLSGWLSVQIRALDAGGTSVRVEARYALRAGSHHWSFFSGGSGRDGSTVCRPRHLLESRILDAARGRAS